MSAVETIEEQVEETGSALDQLLLAERRADERMRNARAEAERLLEEARVAAAQLESNGSAELAAATAALERSVRADAEGVSAAEAKVARDRLARLRAIDAGRVNELANRVIAALLRTARS